MTEPFRCFLCSCTRTKVIPALKRLGDFSPLLGRTVCGQCGAFVRWGTTREPKNSARPESPSAIGKPWTDQTLMPWGTHEDVPLGKVPTSYLAWLARQRWIGEWPDLAEYIAGRLRGDLRRHAAAGE